MSDPAYQFLFIGGSADGRIIDIPVRELAPYRQLHDGMTSENYTKRVCYINRYRENYFAISSMEDDVAFHAYCQKRGVKV